MKTKRQIIFEAAELIGNDETCCGALYRATREKGRFTYWPNINIRHEFQDLFAPNEDIRERLIKCWWKDFSPESQNERVLALLLFREACNE